MSPQASKNRRWLCQSTYSRVAISTYTAVRHAAQNPQIWTISASRWIQPTSAQIGGYGRAVLKGSRAVGNRERRPVCMFMRWPPDRERPLAADRVTATDMARDVGHAPVASRRTDSAKLDPFTSEQPLREQVAMLGWAAEKLLG